MYLLNQLLTIIKLIKILIEILILLSYLVTQYRNYTIQNIIDSTIAIIRYNKTNYLFNFVTTIDRY
jgi:hypothetical protein